MEKHNEEVSGESLNTRNEDNGYHLATNNVDNERTRHQEYRLSIEDKDQESNALKDNFKIDQHYCYCFPTRKLCFLTTIWTFILSFLACIIIIAICFAPAEPLNITKKMVSVNKVSPRILTYNIFMRPPGIRTNHDDYKDERLDQIIKHVLPSFDIIAFQEAFGFANKRIDRLINSAFDQGFHYYVHSQKRYPWDLGIDGGLLLLSRFPIKATSHINFPRGVHSDWLCYKGALHALIELDENHQFHVYTTHTQASYDHQGKLNFDDTKIRLEQFAQIHEFIKETASQDNWPILLMGDLNVNAALPPNTTDITTPSYNSSVAYTMMMDVLSGKGTNLDLIDNTSKKEGKYASSWQLNITDLPYQQFGYHVVTFGDYKKLDNDTCVPTETLFTNQDQFLSVQSIDRLLWSGDRMDQNNKMSLDNITVEHFFVDQNLSLPFTQLSDHYGLSAVLHIK